MRFLPLILTGVLLNAIAQLLLKQGMLRVGLFGFDTAGLGAALPRVLSNPFIWAGLLSYVVSVVVWLLVLSRVEVSYAYPMVSLGYVFALVIGGAVFHENVSAARILGVLVIGLGVILISRTA